MSRILDIICICLSVVFFWSTIVVFAGLVVRRRHRALKTPSLRFAILICARNEERVIARPVESALRAAYPAGLREVIVLADNCSDDTVARARAAGATVWEKTTPSSGKGDVLAWGVERVVAAGSYDAIAVFDADNEISENWFEIVADSLAGGEQVVTGCRQSSNAGVNLISGWYTVYWNIMNELSNRVRTNLSLSGKLSGTGFAMLLSAIPNGGWSTRTMVEDAEFTVQLNLRGIRVAYLPEAKFIDEQPTRFSDTWRQLRRWSTGLWQIVGAYFGRWLLALLRRPSARLFDSFFAIVTGMSIAFIHFFNVLTLIVKLVRGADLTSSILFFLGVFWFVVLMGWFSSIGSTLLSSRERSPKWSAVLTFPVFSFILSAATLFTLVWPSRKWKPIVHGVN